MEKLGPTWEAELDKRYQDIKAAKKKPIPAEEVLANIRKEMSWQ